MSASLHPPPLAEPRTSRLRPDEVARRCTLPNGSERVEIYGLDGRLHRSEEPDGSSIQFRYDIDGGLRSVESSSGERVTYESLSEPRLLRSTTERCDTSIEFDASGFPSRLTQRVDGLEWSVQYRRDEIGRVLACRYPQALDWLQSTGGEEGITVSTDVSAGSRRYFRISVGPQEQRIEFADGTRSVQSTSNGTKLEKFTCYDARGSERLATSFEMDRDRLTRMGQQNFEYDEAGRLARCLGQDQDLEYEYDESQRLIAIRSSDQVTRLGYTVHPAPVRVDDEALTYDSLGRRTGRGDTRYSYNFFGQLTEVVLPDDTRIRYVYDGFGRLVARECDDERVYYIVDFEGHRIAEAASDGRVRRCYLWQGVNCIADIEGVIGDSLSHSFHRTHGGRLHGIGHESGEITVVPAVDPYGADQLRSDGVPSFTSLFSEPLTGLYHAGSRWFDPTTAQFLTPDGWFGTDAWNHLPQAMRSVFDALPGGTNVLNAPQNAYAWCRYDPINYSDPNGHSAVAEGFGMFYSIISFFLWQMQVTSIALQMAALNFIIMLIPSIIDGIVSAAKDKPLWGVNIFNAIPPLIASSRLMVPWAFPLNSLYNAPGTVFTMGSVIWMRGSQHRGLEESGKRDILVCANAGDYVAAGAIDADMFAVSRVKGTGRISAADTGRITTVALDPALAPVTLQTCLMENDPIGVRQAGQVGGMFLKVREIVGGDIRFVPELHPSFANIAMEFVRPDLSLVKIEKDGRTIARSITLIRGKSMHFQNRLPEGFPDSGLKASEYIIKLEHKGTTFRRKDEFPLIEFSVADFASYGPGDFLRILSGSRYFGRKVERKQGTRNVILDTSLPTGGATPLDPNVQVAVMQPTAEGPVNNQSSAADKITVGAARTLRKHDGLTIAVGGTVEDRRIVLQTYLRCAVDNLPASLHGKPLKIDLLLPDVTRGNGKVTGLDTVTVGKDQAKAFSDKQPVKITAGAGKDFSATIKKVTAAAETIQLSENLPAADFPANTAITVVLLKSFKTLDGEPAAAPGGSLDAKSDDLSTPVADSLLLIRPATGADPPAVRKVKGDPVVVAQLDSAPTSNANLTVQTFSPDAAKTRKGEAKKVVLRLSPSPGPHPFANGDELYVRDGTREYIGKNIALPGGDVLLDDPIDIEGFGAGEFEAMLVEPTGKNTPDASLDHSLIAIPSDPDEEPIERSRAVELHEMRHVWQYAVVGPFFFSQPLPWLFHLGFSIAGEGPGHKAHKWTRWFSLGILDKLFSVIAWGIAGAEKDTSVGGTVTNAARTAIGFDAQVTSDQANQFTDGSPIEVAIGDNQVFNIIEKSFPEDRRIDLRFPLEEEFSQGVAVKVTISPFDKINSDVNKYFDLNIAQIWGDHIPTAWGRALNGFLNRESWFPLLGIYPISLLLAGGDQSRLSFEQDASFQSGDLYTNFGVSYPNEIFVGEFSRVLAFIAGRGAGDLATGLSGVPYVISRVLTVEAPVVTGKAPTDLILGSASAGGNEVRFKKEFMLPMHEKVENVIGSMFLATHKGDYKVLSLGFSLDNMVDPAKFMPPFIPFFPASFNELRIIKVKELPIEKVFTDADPLFETESTTFVIKGAEHVTYTIDYKGAAPAVRGDIDRLKFTAPVLGGPKVTHNLAVSSTYGAGHDIFKPKGKLHGQVTLPAASLTNVCQDLDVVIAPITVDPAPTVKAGGSAQLKASISPQKIDRTSGDIAEAKVQADLKSTGGRPAKLEFRAPSKVNAAQDVKYRLTFGKPPHERPIDVTIRVEP